MIQTLEQRLVELRDLRRRVNAEPVENAPNLWETDPLSRSRRADSLASTRPPTHAPAMTNEAQP